MKTMLLFLVLTSTGVADEWTPPENPVPQQIFDEAQKDARERRYADALAKHVWYHRHALEFDEAQGGVRLSFALRAWQELGEKYPPALARLKEIRDETGRRFADVKNGHIRVQDFHDYRAINRTLGDEKLTAEAFQKLDRDDPESAALVYVVAGADLVRMKEYRLCIKYIDPPKNVERICEDYQRHQKLALEPRFKDIMEYGTKKFVNDVTTLVALLVVNDRKAEAEVVAEKAKKVTGDAAFHAKLASEIEKALAGTVPVPWP